MVMMMPLAQKLLTLVKAAPANEKTKHKKNITRIVLAGVAEKVLSLKAIWSLLFLKGILFFIIRKIIKSSVSVIGSQRITIGLSRASALSFDAYRKISVRRK
jgi:hypothetical protein